MLPWSVRAMAGMPRLLARSASELHGMAPSSREYSLWTCRWTNSAAAIGRSRQLTVDTRQSRGSEVFDLRSARPSGRCFALRLTAHLGSLSLRLTAHPRD